MASIRVWFEATRPKTLPAAVAPVFLGTGAAYVEQSAHLGAAFICLAFAVLVQIGTNFANDYLDGIKGTDTEQRLGPVRAVASGQVAPNIMKWVTVAVLVAAFCVGLALIPFGGWWLLLVGAASVACAWLYTGGPYPLAYNGLGDVFVILFFGLIAVGCTYYVQVGAVDTEAFLLGLSCGLLVNNILVVNNYRDLEEDRAANKRTLVVLLGRTFALGQYRASAIIAGMVVLWLAYAEAKWLIALGLIPVCGSLRLSAKLATSVTPKDFLSALKGSALVVSAFALLVTLGLVI